jgi:hypothetical protein
MTGMTVQQVYYRAKKLGLSLRGYRDGSNAYGRQVLNQVSSDIGDYRESSDRNKDRTRMVLETMCAKAKKAG